MNEALRIAHERIKHFQNRGGIDLSGLDPEERDDLVGLVHVGLANYRKAIFWYQCPICQKKISSDQEMAPVCTGPNETLDEHPHESMVLVN